MKLWEWRDLLESTSVSGNGDDKIDTVAFSPDGKTLAVGDRNNITTVIGLPTLRPITGLHCGRGRVAAVAFSPDGQSLAVADGASLILWNWATGERLFTIPAHTKALRSLAFSPDGGRIVTGGNDQLVKVWDLASRREQFTLSGHDGLV